MSLIKIEGVSRMDDFTKARLSVKLAYCASFALFALGLIMLLVSGSWKFLIVLIVGAFGWFFINNRFLRPENKFSN